MRAHLQLPLSIPWCMYQALLPCLRPQIRRLCNFQSRSHSRSLSTSLLSRVSISRTKLNKPPLPSFTSSFSITSSTMYVELSPGPPSSQTKLTTLYTLFSQGQDKSRLLRRQSWKEDGRLHELVSLTPSPPPSPYPARPDALLLPSHDLRDECLAQVKGHPGALYQKFSTPSEARQFAFPGSSAPPPPSTAASSSKLASTSPSASSISSRSSTSSLKRPSSSASSSASAKKKKVETSWSHTASSVTPSIFDAKDRFWRTKSGRIVVYTDGSALGNGMVGSKAGAGVFWGEGNER